MADAVKELIIRIKGDTSPIKSSAAQAAAELRKVDREARRVADQVAREAKRAAEQQAKEARKAADAVAREAKRAADAQAREEARKAAEAKKAADAAAREAKHAADSAAREAKRAADAAAREEARKARESGRAADRMAREAKRAAEAQAREAKKAFDASFVSLQSLTSAAIDHANKQVEAARKRQEKEELLARKTEEAEKKKVKAVLNEEQVSLLARNKLVQEANQKRIDAAAKALSGEKQGFSLSAAAANMLTDAVTGVVGQFTALTVGQRILTGIASATEQARQKQAEYSQEVLRTKEELKELAVLRGLAFADEGFLKEIGQFSRATGLSIPEADQFQRQVYGSAAAGLQKGNIDEETLKELSVKAGSTAARQTKDFGTRGDLIGILSQFRKYDKGSSGVKQALADAEMVRLGLTEGRGDDAPLTKALLNVAGSLAGEGKMVGSLPELAAVVGVMSTSAGPGMADTRTEQLVRGLRGETPNQINFLKQFAGVGENDTLEQRLDKVIPKLREVKAKGRDIPTFLTESGINAEQGRAITEAEANYEVIKKRLATARKGSGDVEAQNKKFEDSPLGQMRKAEADLAVAKLNQGLKGQALEVAKKQAEAELVSEGMDTDTSYATGNFFIGTGTLQPFGGMAPRDWRIQSRALSNLRYRAGFNAGKAPYTFTSSAEEAEFYQQRINEQEAQRAELFRRNPVPIAPGFGGGGRVEQLLERQNQLLYQGLGVGLAPAALPAAPAPAMKRP